MKKKLLTVLASGALLAGIAGTAVAVPISGLYNTGAGHSSPTAAVADDHYDVIFSPNSAALGDASVYKSGTFPVGTNWLADNTTSSWIGPVGLAAGTSPGTYTFETTFNVLSGYDLNSLVINGRWMTDNSGSGIKLNGHNLALSSFPVGFGASNWTDFSITQDFFQLGTNTLDFIVFNAGTSINGNPTGLRVEFAPSGGTPVPEPGTMALLGLGMAGLAIYGKRRKSNEA